MLLKKVYNFLKSSKLAIALIIYGIIVSILGTLIPQNNSISYYVNNYSRTFSYIILRMNLDDITHSIFTVAPLLLFSINLLVCTISRIYTRSKKGAKRRFGPDLIHLSLLFLVAGGAITVSFRFEQSIFLVGNETIKVPEPYSLVLRDIVHHVYDNGKLKDLVSSVDLFKGPELIGNYKIQVNRPLKYDNFVIYQMAYNLKHTVIMVDNNGANIKLESRDLIDLDDEIYIYRGNEVLPNGLNALFSRYGIKNSKIEYFTENDYFGGFRIKKIAEEEETGLKYVRDPGVSVAVVGLILMISGLLLTVFQKNKDGRIGWQQ